MSGASELTSLYDAQGYALAKGVIPPEVAAVFLSITQQAMGDTRADQARFAVNMKPLNRPAYDIYSRDYPAALTFLWALTPFMEAATGKKLLPTYSYFRVYPRGSICLIHADRPACEHSMSLKLGASDGLDWPLAVGKKRLGDDEVEAAPTGRDFGGEAYSEYNLEPGDAVLYQGTRHRHGRLPANPNRWSAHLFCHWVDREGPFKDHAFDKRTLPAPAQFRF